MSDTPRTNALICAPNGNYFSASAEDFRNLCRQLEIENRALKDRVNSLESEAESNAWKISPAIADAKIEELNHRVTSLQCLLNQRWEMMRELEEVCETKDVAKAVEYVKGLKARVKRLEDAGDDLCMKSDNESDRYNWNKAKESKL